MPRVLITGIGAVCGAGTDPDEIFAAVRDGRSAIAPIRQWDASAWPTRIAAEIADFDARAMVEDRKLHKLIRRTDFLGLYAAGRAIDGARIAAHRAGLDPSAAAAFSDRTGVWVGAGGGSYENEYDFFPLLTVAQHELRAFGRELADTVNPMWLLRSLPNNVLGHIGIKYGFKGANACITSHTCSGALAILETMHAVRSGEVERGIAVGHDAPVEPQMVLYYSRLGLVAADTLRPFDARRDGSLLGEGAAALVLETDASAAARDATVLGEVLGAGYASEGLGLLAVRDDGDGLARAIRQALADAQLEPADVGMVVAHGNGTRASDASEAAAIRSVFGTAVPPVTAFKWALGHVISAASALETVVALRALRQGIVPGIRTLGEIGADCAGVRVSAQPQVPRSDVALVLSRGFASTNAALLVRGA